MTLPSRVAEVIHAYDALARARAGLASATIFTFAPPPSVVLSSGSSITLVNRISGRREHTSLGGTLADEVFTIDGEILGLAVGSDDETARDALTIALACYDELDALIVESHYSFGLDGVVATLGAFEYLYSGLDGNRIQGLRYSIDVRAELVT